MPDDFVCGQLHDFMDGNSVQPPRFLSSHCISDLVLLSLMESLLSAAVMVMSKLISKENISDYCVFIMKVSISKLKIS